MAIIVSREVFFFPPFTIPLEIFLFNHCSCALNLKDHYQILGYKNYSHLNKFQKAD